MNKGFITEIGIIVIGATLLVGGYLLSSKTSDNQPTFGDFSDPFLSLQLAESPVSGRILQTDGTDNSWITCATLTGSADLCDGSDDGGGGASFGQAWEVDAGGFLAPTTTITTLHNNGFISQASSTITGVLHADNTIDFQNLFILDAEELSGVQRLRVQGVGANDPVEFLLQPKGSSNSAIFSAINDASNVNFGGLEVGIDANVGFIQATSSGTGTTLPIAFQFDGTEAARFATDGKFGIGTTSPYAKLSVETGSASTRGLVVKGASSQSANLQEWQDSDGNVLAEFQPDRDFVLKGVTNGNITIRPNSSTGTLVLTGTASGMISESTFGAPSFIDSASGNNKLDIGAGSWQTLASNITFNVGFALSGGSTIFQSNSAERVRITSAGNLGIGTSTPSEKLSVEGNVLADAYLEFSDTYRGDALSDIKNIRAEANAKGDWAPVDHDTLPQGVRYEKTVTQRVQIGTTTEDVFDDELQATTTIDVPTYATSTYQFVGRNLGNSVQLNLRAIQQLIEKVEILENENLQQQAEIEALKLRMDALDGLGTEPVIVDKEGNLLSASLWVGFGTALATLVGAWLVKRKKSL